MSPIDPDCTVGKHHACIGNTWDVERDEPADCACPCHLPPEQQDGT